jgi:hypothetical protein
VFQRPVEVGAELGAPIRGKNVLQEEIAVAVELFDPFVDLGAVDFLTG